MGGVGCDTARGSPHFTLFLCCLRRLVQRRGIPCGPIRPADETGYCALPAASPLNHVHVDWSEHKA